MEQFLNELNALHIADYIGLITGILYVVLAARGKRLCWVFGGISSLSIAYGGFFLYQLYSDGILNLIYFGMAVWGIIAWNKSGGSTIQVTKLKSQSHVRYILVSVLAAIPISYLFGQYTDAALPFLDASTTCLALSATIMTIRKNLESWLYWLVIDLVYVGIYFSQGAWLYSLLFVVYIIVAIQGFLNWQVFFKKSTI
mgnify:FL=1